MTQVSSNTLAYDQIYIKVRDFYIKEYRGEFASNQDRLNEYKNLILEIYETVTGPLTKFDPYIKGEPPMADKFNKFSVSLGTDIGLISKQVDYVNAKAINAFNLYTSEVEAEKRYIERISSKAKILQMYSKAPAEDLIYVGDTFDNSDFVDITKIPQGLNPLIKDGMLTLPIAKSRPWIPKDILIDTTYSNGFMGNDHQVIKDLNPTNNSEYDYIYQTNTTISSLSAIADANPLTFFEYEGLKIDRATSDPVADINLVSNDEFCYIVNKSTTNNRTTGTLTNWSEFNLDNPLKLRITMNNPSAAMANSIKILPYFGSSKLVKVTAVKAQKQNGDTIDILSSPIYIGTSFAPLSLEMSSNYFFNEAVIKFTELKAVKFHIDFEQESANDILVKHAYFKPSFANNTGQNNPFYGLSRFNPKALSTDLYDNIEYDQYKLIPSLSQPNQFKNYTNYSDTVQVRLTRKPTVFNDYAITFTASRPNTDISIKFYYYNGIYTNGAMSDFRLVDNLASLYTPDDQAVNDAGSRLTFTSPEDGESELNAFIDFMNDTYYDEISEKYSIQIGNYVYEIDPADIVIELASYTTQTSSRSWTVPVSLDYELYNAKRKSIGIRDISISYESYADRTEVVSTPYYFNSPIESLMLSVESTYDNTFIDRFEIQYHISVNDSAWIQISPIQLAANGIAEVLVFNKNIPTNYQIPGVAYINYPEVPSEINKVVVKISIAKERFVNITPEVYSYQLMAKVKKQ